MKKDNHFQKTEAKTEEICRFEACGTEDPIAFSRHPCHRHRCEVQSIEES